MDVDEHVSPEEASDILFDLLVDLKLRSKISATDACVIAYWSVLSGSPGKGLKKLAKRPGDLSTGHYGQKFDSATGLNQQGRGERVMQWIHIWPHIPNCCCRFGVSSLTTPRLFLRPRCAPVRSQSNTTSLHIVRSFLLLPCFKAKLLAILTSRCIRMPRVAELYALFHASLPSSRSKTKLLLSPILMTD